MVHLTKIKRRLRMARSYAASLPGHLSTKGISLPALSAHLLFGFLCASVLLACTLFVASSTAWATEANPAETSTDASLVESAENTINARQIADNSFLYDTSIYELVQADSSYQGATVQIVGEVVGNPIRAEEDPGKVWLTLEASEEEYESSISVLVSEEITSIIDTYGGYNRRGTKLQVHGTYYLACPSHEGIMDIHADAVTLVARGSTTSDEFVIGDFIPGAILVAVGLLLTLIYYFLRERER